MIDVRVSVLGPSAVIELLNDKAKNWYANNVEGAPAVSSDSVVLDAGPAEDMVEDMIRGGLKVERKTED